MSYIGRSSKLFQRAYTKVSFLATAGQTSKTGLSYTPSFVELYVNGVLLTDTTDYTATNGNSITFTVALLVNDEVTVVSLKTFASADHYTKSEDDALLAAKLALAGGTMTGDTAHGDNVKAKFGAGDDLVIYHSGANSIIKDGGTGDLLVQANQFKVQSASGADDYIVVNPAAGVTLSYTGSNKLATISTGVDVTGDVVNSGGLYSNVNNSLKILSGGNASNAGSNLTLYGGTNASAGTFRFRNGTTVLASITGASLGNANSGIYFGVNGVYPSVNGAVNDNSIDLGAGSWRWDDIYATNGTIQTSDRNEKQDILAITTAESNVATACKGLLRSFRWKDAVAEKGDDARIHFGIIAQDLQAAFAAEGLDAGDYAMFISSTWWETQTEVPAVLAEDATEDSEAVEAKDAYTRTDTFDTLEEAPEGATERTRLGVRYPELLSFIIAAALGE